MINDQYNFLHHQGSISPRPILSSSVQEQEPSVVLCDPRDARGIYIICNKWVPTPNSFRTPSIQRPLSKGLSERIRCSRPLPTDSTAFHIISNFSPYLENITPRFSPVEGTSSLFKVSKGRRWAENKFGLVCSFRKGFSMTNFWNDATRRVIRKSI